MLIVTYHAIAAPASPVCCPLSQFEEDLVGLESAGFAFVSLDECAEWLEGRRQLPGRAVAITFDDAYASVFSKALPVLTRLRVPATVFAIGARIGGDNQWPGQWKSIPSMPLAGLGELKDGAAAGVAIGSHSWSHAVLTGLDQAALHSEVDESAGRLEELLGVAVRHFAYPYGIRGSREIAATRRRYRTAVNASPGPVPGRADPHDLCRIDCADLRVALRLKLVDEPALRPYLAVRRFLRSARRGVEGLTGAR